MFMFECWFSSAQVIVDSELSPRGPPSITAGPTSARLDEMLMSLIVCVCSREMLPGTQPKIFRFWLVFLFLFVLFCFSMPFLSQCKQYSHYGGRKLYCSAYCRFKDKFPQASSHSFSSWTDLSWSGSWCTSPYTLGQSITGYHTHTLKHSFTPI